MPELKSEFIFELYADLGAPQILANNPHGTRQIIPAISGTLKGPSVNGELLPGGGDWLLFRADGVGELDVRATAKLDDGELVYIYYGGYAVVPPELLGRIAGGGEVDPSQYYFRTTPAFETASQKYHWLNQTIAVGVGKLGPGLRWVSYSIFRIL